MTDRPLQALRPSDLSRVPSVLRAFRLFGTLPPDNDGSNKAPLVSRVEPRPHSCYPAGADAARYSCTFFGTFFFDTVFFGTFFSRTFFGTLIDPFGRFTSSERERASFFAFVNGFSTDSAGKTTAGICGATGAGWGIQGGGDVD